MIVLDGVGVSRGGRDVLADLTLTLGEKRIGVIGANGSGKSTFARLLNGLLLPTVGQVLVGGLDTARDGKAVRRKVGFVFQNPDSQIVYPSVGEDLAFGLKGRGLSKPEIAARIAGVLESQGLAGSEGRLIHELSGGERQLVALAGVMVMQPEVLVLDEPTTLLDLRNTSRIATAIAAFPGRLVMVTHDLDLLAAFDRVLVFEEGRLHTDAPPNEAIARYLALCR
ncbi:putative ABC transporter ATP-binding protein [Aureimonas sp. SA4125]|uniref:energy-coupling factor ABC transporter ATP-binding protein n=1 Tax=Aureimonas sp. SA4125 TaxID=2826993 RepID=UPI001CC6FD3C|nr:ABC transporter ATP-binding protein [Aureimonas sp. SA4125]BDA83868.1 putative ABC transporter ATP-binding protein [Aureimonas sp. SA4125]